MKTRITSLLLLFFLFNGPSLLSDQNIYPFLDNERNFDIQAYWYNIPSDFVALDVGQKLDFHPFLHVYGKTPADEFQVGVEVYLENGHQILEKKFDIDTAEESNFVEFRNGFFKIKHPGKKTVIVEYKKEVKRDQKNIMCTSMGVFQFYLNFKGISKYF